jgi:SAM-dependent methyltransferase
MDTRLSERDRAEVQRSAEEARKLVVEPLDLSEIERYANPPSDTQYPLEYAFHLLGDVRGKTVLDFGCGRGENVVPLVLRGAHAIGLDVSPELIGLARQRLDNAGLKADLRVGSAYATDLPDGSVDVIFSISLIHHLDIGQVTGEMLRILAKGGRAILKEPIRFSASYARLRNLLPARGDISEYEHPYNPRRIRDPLRALQARRGALFPAAICPSDAAHRRATLALETLSMARSALSNSRSLCHVGCRLPAGDRLVAVFSWTGCAPCDQNRRRNGGRGRRVVARPLRT